VTDTDRVHEAAQVITDAFRRLPAESQQAYRYLFARVALDAGLYALVNDQLPEGGLRLVLREKATGKLFAVQRPHDWTREEEEQHVADMRRRMLGPDEPSPSMRD
jgi:hypothetical protein